MSLLSQLQHKKKHLNKTSTVITRNDGSVYSETIASLVSGAEPEKLNAHKYGFVVDTKPDNVPIEVIKGLFLGSQDCADDNILKLYSIDYVLSIGVDSNIPCDKKLFIECLDLAETEIVELLQQTNPCIEKILKDDKNILVHCNAGVSRSASVVIGYLIQIKGLSYEEAFELVKSKRPCIQPNSGFVMQLKMLNPQNKQISSLYLQAIL